MPYYFFFIIILFRGTIISISSINWVYVWMGLEINLLSFIPLLVCGVSELEVERSLKYFLVQALGSSFVLFGCFSVINYPHVILSIYMRNIILLFSFIIKLGIFPFHFWLPRVMGGLSWISCLLLAVWQKVGPLFIIIRVIKNIYCWILLIFGCLGSIIGGVGGINQSQIRILLAYSSIGHIRWIFIGIVCSFNVTFYYYIIYRFIIISIISIIYIYPSKIVNLINFRLIPFFFILFMCVLFLSLAGIPPFFGFFPKLILINLMIDINIHIYILILILGSLINIFYYLNVFFNLFIGSFLVNFSSTKLNIRFIIRIFVSIFWVLRIYILGLFT